ncbi:hypothetical protein ACFL26_00505 [Patescibacteria group bacterium]
MNKDLDRFVQQALSERGLTPQQVVTELMATGWSHDEAVESVARVTGRTPSEVRGGAAVAPPPREGGPQSSAGAAPGRERRLYNPHLYLPVGFFFGLVPLYIMSWRNAKALRDFEPSLSELVRKHAIGFVSAFAVAAVFMSVALYQAVGEIARMDIDVGTGRTVAGMQTQTMEAPSPQTFGVTVGQFLLMAVHIGALVMFLLQVGQREKRSYDELRRRGQVRRRGILGPLVIGLLVSTALGFGAAVLMGAAMFANLQGHIAP